MYKSAMVKHAVASTHNRQVGVYGENVAEHYLIRKGHSIVRRNLTLRSGEIDILSYKDNYLYINEVKTGTRGSVVLPELNLTRRKLMRLKRLALELESVCYTRNSFMINMFEHLEPPIINGVIINGICVYLTLNSTLDARSGLCVYRISVKFFADIFNS